MNVDEFDLSIALMTDENDPDPGLDFDIDSELTTISKKPKTSNLNQLERFKLLQMQNSLLRKYEISRSNNTSSEHSRQLRLVILFNKTEKKLQN